MGAYEPANALSYVPHYQSGASCEASDKKAEFRESQSPTNGVTALCDFRGRIKSFLNAEIPHYTKGNGRSRVYDRGMDEIYPHLRGYSQARYML